GLEHRRVAGNDGGHRHATHDRAREVPRRNDRTDTERDVTHLVVFTGHLRYRCTIGEAQHFAAVVLGEIDQFRDVAIGFRPVLADFVDHPRRELELAFADLRGHAEQACRTVARVRVLPGLERTIRCLDCLPRVLVRALDDAADDDRAIERAAHFDDRAVADFPAIDDHRPGAAELAAHLRECLLHRLAVFRLRAVGERLVPELAYHVVSPAATRRRRTEYFVLACRRAADA